VMLPVYHNTVSRNQTHIFQVGVYRLNHKAVVATPEVYLLIVLFIFVVFIAAVVEYSKTDALCCSFPRGKFCSEQQQ